MRIHIECDKACVNFEPRVGNVYPRRGGRGSALGHMMILLHITEPAQYEGRTCLMLIVNKDGVPCSVDKYSFSYLEDKCPIAFVEGITDIDLTMRSL